MNKIIKLLSIFILTLLPLVSQAADNESLLMVRSSQSFESTLDKLSVAIAYNEYKISRIQRVDVGLTKTGYKTEKYRLVFFFKPGEINKLANKYPELIPYMPIKLIIFAEGKETILLAMNPYQLRKLVPKKELYGTYQKWEEDIRSILQAAKD